MNSNILDLLNQLLSKQKNDHKMLSGDSKKTMTFKIRALENAIREITSFDSVITNGKDVAHLKGVGDKTVKKINEILETSYLQELDNEIIITDDIKHINDLQRITGIGESIAKKLVSKYGIISAEQLIDAYTKSVLPKGIKLNHHIEIGIKYFNDLQLRIPREEITCIEQIIRRIFPFIQFDICGSYRRLLPSCGDIDLLICDSYSVNSGSSSESKCSTDYIQLELEISHIVSTMKSNNIIIDDLSVGHNEYKGICKNPNNIDSMAMRIDIRIVKQHEYYSALLHSTGSAKLNIIMRNKAIAKGFLLNQYGLFDTHNNPFPIMCEKDIFDLLDMSYLAPIERNLV